MPAVNSKPGTSTTRYNHYEYREIILIEDRLEKQQREDMARLKLTWMPAKVKSTPACTPKKQYQRIFTGTRFRIGGSKK